MWKVILLCAFVGITAGELVTYDNYKLYHVLPQTEKQIEMLQFYYKFLTSRWYDLWNTPSTKNTHINIMVYNNFAKMFERTMISLDMKFKLLEDNVQTLINLRTKEGQSSSFDFTSYHTLEEIYKNLDYMAEIYPENVKIIVGGSTYEGRQIKGVKISFNPNNPGVFLEGGINAREWMAPAVVMYIIHQLLTSHDRKIRNMAESHDWYIFPVFNPDGYEYTHTTDRMWTKTRKLYRNSTISSFIGSNPNKNWDYKWDGSTFIDKSNMFAGPEPFSEVETKSMSEYIESIKDKFFAYFSFHSHSPDMMYPPDEITNDTMSYEWYMELIAYKPCDIPYPNAPVIRDVFSHEEPRMFKNIVKTSDFDRGSSITYIKGTYNKPLVLAYGLQDEFSHDGFLQSPERIVWFGQDAVYSLESMLDRAKLISFDK